MHMLMGTLIPAVLILAFLHLVFWKIRSIHWINNDFATFVACVSVIAVAVAFFVFVGGTHFAYMGLEMIALGIPSFLVVKNFPSPA